MAWPPGPGSHPGVDIDVSQHDHGVAVQGAVGDLPVATGPGRGVVAGSTALVGRVQLLRERRKGDSGGGGMG